MRWYLGFYAYSSLGWTPSPTNSCIEDNMYHHVQMLVLGALDVIIADVSARHLHLSFKYLHISTTKVGDSLLLMVHFFPFPTTFWMFYIETLFFYNRISTNQTSLRWKSPMEEGEFGFGPALWI